MHVVRCGKGHPYEFSTLKTLKKNLRTFLFSVDASVDSLIESTNENEEPFAESSGFLTLRVIQINVHEILESHASH